MYYSKLNYRRKRARMRRMDMVRSVLSLLSLLSVIALIAIGLVVFLFLFALVFELLTNAVVWVWISLTGDVMPYEIAATIVATYIVSIIWLSSGSSLSSKR